MFFRNQILAWGMAKTGLGKKEAILKKDIKNKFNYEKILNCFEFNSISIIKMVLLPYKFQEVNLEQYYLLIANVTSNPLAINFQKWKKQVKIFIKLGGRFYLKMKNFIINLTFHFDCDSIHSNLKI